MSEMIKYERMKVSNKIIRDLDINVASCSQGVRRGLATKETNYPSTEGDALISSSKSWSNAVIRNGTEESVGGRDVR